MNQLSDLCGVWACRAAEVKLLTNGTLSQQQMPAAFKGGGLNVRGGVATIHINGMLSKQVSWWSTGTSTVEIRNQVRAAAAAPDVRAIVLYVESPGGTAAGILELAQDILAAREQKPVVSYISDLGCSAAYWLAASAGRVYANPTAIVGSIGTYTCIYDSSGMAAKAGVVAHVVRAGSMKGAFAPGSPVTAEQLAEVQKIVNALNDHFVAGVATGRRMSRKAAEQLADGRVHVGQAAVQAGLVDEIKTFDAVLASISAGAVPAMTQPKGRPTMNASQQIEELVAAKLQANPRLTRGAAMQAVCKENPELREQWVSEHNEQHRDAVQGRRR